MRAGRVGYLQHWDVEGWICGGVWTFGNRGLVSICLHQPCINLQIMVLVHATTAAALKWHLHDTFPPQKCIKVRTKSLVDSVRAPQVCNLNARTCPKNDL